MRAIENDAGHFAGSSGDNIFHGDVAKCGVAREVLFGYLASGGF